MIACLARPSSATKSVLYISDGSAGLRSSASACKRSRKKGGREESECCTSVVARENSITWFDEVDGGEKNVRTHSRSTFKDSSAGRSREGL